MPGQPRKQFLDRQLFVDELVAMIRANPAAITQKGMADAFDVSQRTLTRWLHDFKVAWPPIDRNEWKQLAQQAATQPPAIDAWLITCRVTAATLSDAEAKLRADDGIFIIEAKRLESASVPASIWRIPRADTA